MANSLIWTYQVRCWLFHEEPRNADHIDHVEQIVQREPHNANHIENKKIGL